MIANNVSRAMQPAIKPADNSIKRTFDAARLNAVANHEAVRPHIGGTGEIDLTGIVKDPSNFALEVDGGGFVMQAKSPGIYEVHSLFLPEARWMTSKAMQDGMRYMFCCTPCFRLLTRVPDGNVAAAALARKGGFVSWFKRGADDYLALDLDGWITTAQWADAIGEDFHALLGEQVNHDDDPLHDRFVGVAIEMAMSANLAKGIGAYNRWASFAGYVESQIVSVAPPIVDIGGAVVGLTGGKLEILSCQ